MIKKLKSIYRFYLDFVEKIKYYIFLNKTSKCQSKNVLLNDGSEIDIVTIAFNNPLVIEYQIKILKKYVMDDFTHIIADNSSEIKAQKAIFEICKTLNIHYVKIPKNDLFRNKSHGGAMHWTYKNILRKRNSPYFGFLDHDIFPTNSYSILKKMKNNIYGRVIHSYKKDGYNSFISKEFPYWSLWAGFYFLKSDLLFSQNIYTFNFFPKSFQNGVYLDTGGGLWNVLMSKMIYPGELAIYKSMKFRDSELSNVHTDYIEYFDDWIHFVNVSNWYKTPKFEEKNNYIINKLSSILDNKNIKIN